VFYRQLSEITRIDRRRGRIQNNNAIVRKELKEGGKWENLAAEKTGNWYLREDHSRKENDGGITPMDGA